MNEIERAKESTKARIFYIESNAKNGTYQHCVKADKQKEIQKVILEALEYRTVKNPKNFTISENMRYYECPTCHEWVGDEFDICCVYCGQLINVE